MNSGGSTLPVAKTRPVPKDPLRLFLAFEISDSQRDALAGLRAAAPAAIAKTGRWVPAANWHLTLHFLGDVPGARLNELKDAFATVSARPATLALQGLGCFPKRGAARVLWAGVAADPALSECHEQLTQALARQNFSLPERPFSPHITLARFRPPQDRAVLAPWLSEQRNWQGPKATLTHFTLFESQLGRGSPRYLPLVHYPLTS